MKKKDKKKETYSPQKHEWGTDAAAKFARKTTPGQKSEQMEKPMKTFSDIYEKVQSADKKPQNYKDPETGKIKTRMVPVDKEIVKESHFKVGQKVKCKASGMTGTVTKLDPEEKGKYYTVKRSDGKVVKYAPDELTAVQKESVEQLDEIVGKMAAAKAAFGGPAAAAAGTIGPGASVAVVTVAALIAGATLFAAHEVGRHDGVRIKRFFSKLFNKISGRDKKSINKVIELMKTDQVLNDIVRQGTTSRGFKSNKRREFIKRLKELLPEAGYDQIERAANNITKVAKEVNKEVKEEFESNDDIMEAFPYRDMTDTGADEEAQMAVRQLHFIQYAAEEIMEYVEMRGDLDEWFQNKLSAVHSKMQGLHSFIEGDKRAMGMDEEFVESKENKLKVGSKSAKDYRDSEKDNPVGGVPPKRKIRKYYKPRKEEVEEAKRNYTPQERSAARLAKRARDRDAEGKSRKMKLAPLKLSPAAQKTMDKIRARNKKREAGNYKESTEGTRTLSEPATSKAQQQAAGAALAAKRGEVNPSELKGASRDMYKSMSKKELEDFASTKHKGLPTRKESNDLGVAIPMEYDENNNLVPKEEGTPLWTLRKRINNED